MLAYKDFSPRDLTVVLASPPEANALLRGFRAGAEGRDVDAYCYPDLADLTLEVVRAHKRRARDTDNATVLVLPAWGNSCPGLLDLPEALEDADLILAVFESTIAVLKNRSGLTGSFFFPEVP